MWGAPITSEGTYIHELKTVPAKSSLPSHSSQVHRDVRSSLGISTAWWNYCGTPDTVCGEGALAGIYWKRRLSGLASATSDYHIDSWLYYATGMVYCQALIEFRKGEDVLSPLLMRTHPPDYQRFCLVCARTALLRSASRWNSAMLCISRTWPHWRHCSYQVCSSSQSI